MRERLASEFGIAPTLERREVPRTGNLAIGLPDVSQGRNTILLRKDCISIPFHYGCRCRPLNTIQLKVKRTLPNTGSISKRPKKSGMMETQSKAKRLTHRKRGITESQQSLENSGQRSSLTGREESGSSQYDVHEHRKLPNTVEEFDRRFDAGEDLADLGVDLSKATRPGLEIKRVNVDLPAHFIDKLDRCATLRGLTRQALIKAWLYERLEREAGL